MAKSDLRLVRDAEPAPAGPTNITMVPLTVREVFPLLASAFSHKSPWLEDFADDPIHITEDLAELLVFYQQFTREKSA